MVWLVREECTIDYNHVEASSMKLLGTEFLFKSALQYGYRACLGLQTLKIVADGTELGSVHNGNRFLRITDALFRMLRKCSIAVLRSGILAGVTQHESRRHVCEKEQPLEIGRRPRLLQE